MSIGDEYKYHKEIEEVCRAATEKGILIVAAYSNQQVEATYPASFPFVMGVRCLDIENPLQVLQYDGTGTDVIFSSKFFSLYHVGIPKFYQGNSFGCAVITGYGMDQSLLSIKNKKFPSALPVLTMISSENVQNVPAWETAHRNQLDLESGNHQLYIVNGGHYIWYTNLTQVVQLINEWRMENHF